MTSRRQEYRDALESLGRISWPAYLREHSGLPGARANLELAQAVADIGEAPDFARLTSTDDEYLVLCGVVGLGQVLADRASPDVEAHLREYARDGRWRVREGVAMALQRLGDADSSRLRRLTREWADDADPLVQRAAVAGICEPRLLRQPDNRAHALALCHAVTESLAERPVEVRASDGVRVLRQALGYCWSVAVAADPSAGLPLFAVLSGHTDPDVQWIVRENRKKSRLARLL